LVEASSAARETALERMSVIARAAPHFFIMKRPFAVMGGNGG
jgi:hypothetical protein